MVNAMAKIKLVLGDKSGKTKQIEVEGDSAKPIMGLAIGDTLKGEAIDMPGYEFLITGGSDSSGFPMRADIAQSGKQRILITKGHGLKKARDGMRKRRTIAGGVVGAKTAQVNLKITKTGSKPLFEEPKEEASAEKKEE